MTAGFKFPSAEETMRHPAFASTVWALEPHAQGDLDVGKKRGGAPMNIHWEVHGEGPTKLVFLMGLVGTITSWQIQTHHFGHVHGDKYSVLVLDNRGIGRSDKPLERYTTSGMARDALEVIDHVGWERINIMGISLGGMIAQELAQLLMAGGQVDRIQSLALISTSSHVESGKPWYRSAVDRALQFRPKTQAQTIQDAALSIFVPDFLAARDQFVLPDPGSTPRCAPAKTPSGEYLNFDCNYQRFQAQEMHKRQRKGHFTLVGFMCQLAAAATHHKTSEQLARMADAIGRHKILVMHGERDKMIAVANGKKLIDGLNPGEGLIIEGLGHAPIFERSAWFNDFMQERWDAWAKL